MSDDRTQRGPQDRSRININEDYELQYWSQKFGVTDEELVSAVDAVGPMVNDVAQRLGKSAA
jgi:hypothetical protein